MEKTLGTAVNDGNNGKLSFTRTRHFDWSETEWRNPLTEQQKYLHKMRFLDKLEMTVITEQREMTRKTTTQYYSFHQSSGLAFSVFPFC